MDENKETPPPSSHLRGADAARDIVDQIEKDILTNPAVAIATTSYRWREMRSSWEASILSALSDKPIICVGTHTIDKLKSGEHVEIGSAIMIPASDLSDPEPGEHQEVLDAIAAHNSGEEE